jgi:hypothetical protein
MSKTTITERQGAAAWPSQYSYVRQHPSGLHEFLNEDGKPEVFAKRRCVAGWHLKRGAWSYEFIRSGS